MVTLSYNSLCFKRPKNFTNGRTPRKEKSIVLKAQKALKGSLSKVFKVEESFDEMSEEKGSDDDKNLDLSSFEDEEEKVNICIVTYIASEIEEEDEVVFHNSSSLPKTYHELLSNSFTFSIGYQI
ncbi:hypothetical protein CR513_58715, partial [Mucuna pruriens]